MDWQSGDDGGVTAKVDNLFLCFEMKAVPPGPLCKNIHLRLSFPGVPGVSMITASWVSACTVISVQSVRDRWDYIALSGSCGNRLGWAEVTTDWPSAVCRSGKRGSRGSGAGWHPCQVAHVLSGEVAQWQRCSRSPQTPIWWMTYLSVCSHTFQAHMRMIIYSMCACANVNHLTLVWL